MKTGQIMGLQNVCTVYQKEMFRGGYYLLIIVMKGIYLSCPEVPERTNISERI